jgi:hypothetical protein
MKYVLALSLTALFSGQSDDILLKVEEKKAEHWKKVLEKSPDDQEANQALGRYLCFCRADWDAGLPFLAKGKDKGLTEFAQHELGTLELPSLKDSPLTGATFDCGEKAAPDLVLGDALWDLMKKYKDRELESRNIMNRAIWRYRAALSKVDDAHRKKLLDRISKVMDRFRAMYTHPGKVFEGAPKGWGVVVGKGEKIEGVATDESRSRTGRASLRVTPAKAGLLVTERKPIMPGEHVLSFWYLAEGTVAPDLFQVWLFDRSEACRRTMPPVPADRGEIPVWTRVEIKVKVDSEILFFRLYIDNVAMREGTLWIDDLSFKSPKGEELTLNGGFEER